MLKFIFSFGAIERNYVIILKGKSNLLERNIRIIIKVLPCTLFDILYFLSV